METLQLDLDVVLPHAHHGRDKCVSDLLTVLGRFDGVEAVHVIDPEGEGPAQICLHLERGAVSLPRLGEMVRSTGAEIENHYGHLIVETVPAGNTSRASAMTERLQSLDGVVDGTVSIGGVVRVEYDRDGSDETKILERLRSIGIEVLGPAGPVVDDRVGPVRAHDDALDDDQGDAHGSGDGHEHGHGASRIELGAAILSLAIYLVARSLDWFSDIDGPVTAMYVAAALLTGVFVTRDAWLSVKARVFDIDQLMLVAAVGAALLGQWADSALLLVLFSLGHALEGYAMNRARNAIEALSELAPATARRRQDPTVDVPIEELLIGDVVVVRPNERLPVDGVIVTGATSIDESSVTGESVPVDKSAIDEVPEMFPDRLAGHDNRGILRMEDVPKQHQVFAGTLNGSSAIDVMALRVAADSTLARVVQLVAEAETQISPTQRFTKRIVRVFVPSVLVLVGVLLVAPPLLGEDFSKSFARAMAVLVAASPCALAIATPSAVLAAIARSARSGILVKGGGPLEALGSVKAIAFDKTGTLTSGKPVLTDVVPAQGIDEIELMSVALTVEQASDHPIARAITAGIEPLLAGPTPDSAADVTSIHGKGVTGRVDGNLVMIGNAALFDEVGLPGELAEAQQSLEADGRTTMIVRSGNRFLGVIGVMDTPREQAAATVESLRDMGIEQIVMLSGDNQMVADAVGSQVGIDSAIGGLLPADKVAAINDLASSGGVAMIGDGVNDAPALAAANVGIAMGAAGSDVALETADIALMSDQIEQLPFAVGISRRASRTIKQNLFFSLGVVAVLIPMTILGVGISVAVIAHEGSTLIVVANALLLLRYKGPRSTSFDFARRR